MKREKRKLLFMLLFLIVLIITATVLWVPERKKQRTVSEIEKNWSVGESRVVNVKIKSYGKEMTINRKNDGFEVSGISTEQLDRNVAEQTLRSLESCVIEESLGVQKNLTQFGLKDAPEIYMIMDDGKEQKFLVGNLVPGQIGKRYILLEDEVYVIKNFPDTLLNGEKAFYSSEILKGTGASMGVNYIELSGNNFPEKIYVERNEAVGSGYRMQKPAVAEAMIEPVLESLENLIAFETVEIDATKERIKEYGLDKPEACIRYGVNGTEYVIKVGERMKDNSRYVMTNKNDNIYRVSEDKIEKWADSNAMDFRASYLWLVDVNLLEGLELTDGTTRYKWRIRNEEDEESGIKIRTNLGRVDEKEWLTFYQELLGMVVMNMEEKEIVEKETYAIKYIYTEKSGISPIEIKLYQSVDGSVYSAWIDDEFAGNLRKSTVNKVWETAEKVYQDAEENQ